MIFNRFFKPKLIIQNITTSDVGILGVCILHAGETKDIFDLVYPNDSFFEDLIIKGLEQPWGSLYIQQEILKLIIIHEVVLATWNYALVRPYNIQATNNPVIGYVPTYTNENEFTWLPTSGLVPVEPPLDIVDGRIVIPEASQTVDGYLSADYFSLFLASAKRAQKIWQYQDFAAPVGTSLTITAFENGSDLTFNSGYIEDNTAVITLVSDTSAPPTSTLTFPANILPSSRVNVNSHTGTTVILNQSPDASLNVRVFFLISVPANVQLPINYQEDLNFLNDTTYENLDEFYVNKNSDETIYGDKTFADSLIAQTTFQLVAGATDGYYLKSDGYGYGTWAPVVGGGGTSDHGLLIGLSDDDHPQYYNSFRLDSVLDGYIKTSQTYRLLPSVIGPDGYILQVLSGNPEWVQQASSLDFATLQTILDGYVDFQDLDSALDGYLTSNSLASLFDGYVTDIEFILTLDGYVTDNEFALHTGDSSIHFTQASLNLGQYVTESELSFIIDGYALSSEIITDHGALSGLADDDHPQYYNESRLNSVIDGYIYDAENVGNDGYGVFYQKVGDTLQFKNIAVGSTKLTIAEASNNIVIDADTDVLRVALNEPEFEPTGFPNRDDSQISFDDGTRTFTIEPVGASFDVYCKAQRLNFSSPQTVIIPNSSGLYYVYFDKDSYVLTASNSFDISIITKHAFCAVIYWNVSQAKHIYFGDERHGITMDGFTHAYLHRVNGTVYLGGLALDNIIADGDGNDNTHTQFTTTAGIILDEDIQHSLPPETEIPVYYQSGSDGYWFVKDADAFPVIYSGTAGYTGSNGRLPYNYFDGSAWSLEEVPNNDFVLIHILATNDIVKPVVAIQGIASYATITAARTAAREEIGTLTGLPFVEFVAIGTVVYQTANGYANIPQARIRSTDSGLDYIDWRQTTAATSSISSDHGLLSGLSDDDHTHYYNAARLAFVLDGYATTAQLDLHTNDATIHFTVGDLGLDGYFYKPADQTVTGHTTFDPSITTDPAFTISPNGATPTTNVADGSVAIVGGIQYNYDGTRAKWLSNERKFLVSGRNANNVTNAYINVVDGVVSSSTGYRLLRDATITGIWAQTEDIETWVFEVRRNGVVTVVASLSITASRGDSDPAVNVDVNADDEIQFYVNGTGIGRPVVGIELAWRIA